jgi:hypothetical protein
VDPKNGELDLTTYVSSKRPLLVIGGFKLLSGEVFIVLSVTVPMSPKGMEKTAAARKEGRKRVHAHFDWSPQNGPRTMITKSGPSGVPTFLDVRA